MRSKKWLQWFDWALLYAFLLSACSGAPGTLAVQITPTPPPQSEPASTLTPTPRPTLAAAAATDIPSPTAPAEPLIPSLASPTTLDCQSPAPAPAGGWKFVFVSQEKLMIQEAGAEARLLAEMSGILQPDFTRDGNQVVFHRVNPSGFTEVWSVNTGGQDLKRLSDEETFKGSTGVFDGSFSPDGKSVAIIYRPEDMTLPGELWITRLDGSGTEKLVEVKDLASFFEFEDESGVLITSMTWIPASNRVILLPYASFDYVLEPLVWVDAESGELGEFLPNTTGGYVKFSPDGKWFTLATKTSLSLVDRQSLETITQIDIPELAYTGVWTPQTQWARDSSRFQVALPPADAHRLTDYTVAGPVSLWSVGVDGTDPQEIGNLTADLSEVAFSPDLALTAFADGGQIEILDSSGSSLNKLSAPEDAFGMSDFSFRQWSPDSRHFTYLAGSDNCACGFDIIADVCSDDRIKLQEQEYFSGYVTGFVAWLDSNHYLYFDYPANSIETADLVLGSLDGEKTAWPVQPDRNMLATWVP